MTGVKRSCPFTVEQGEFTYNANGEIISVSTKRHCHDSPGAPVGDLHLEAMEYQAYSGQQASTIPKIQVQQETIPAEASQCPATSHHNNNYLNPPKSCLRCQAGEPGHFSHIGR